MASLMSKNISVCSHLQNCPTVSDVVIVKGRRRVNDDSLLSVMFQLMS